MIKFFYNEADLEIDITGGIGADWFGDGNTRESVLNQIKDSEAENITVNIHSLGGDLLEALAIHDALKLYPARVTAKIVGATASAGTVIAMAADSVEITENSKFLIHNASTLTAGNAEEHQKSADQLTKFDNDIINIYRKKTGKPKSEIKNLMAKEIWIDAQEAKSWGFVDKVIKTTNKVENYKKYSEILNINHTTMNKEVLELLNITEEGEALAAIQNIINERDTLKGEVAEFESLQEQFNDLKAEMEADKAAKINTIVDDAIKAGKVKADNKNIYVDLLTENFENGKKILDSIEVPKATMRAVAAGISDEPVKDWKWYIENDREGLYKMAKTNPEKYQEILKTK